MCSACPCHGGPGRTDVVRLAPMIMLMMTMTTSRPAVVVVAAAASVHSISRSVTDISLRLQYLQITIQLMYLMHNL